MLDCEGGGGGSSYLKVESQQGEDEAGGEEDPEGEPGGGRDVVELHAAQTHQAGQQSAVESQHEESDVLDQHRDQTEQQSGRYSDGCIAPFCRAIMLT